MYTREDAMKMDIRDYGYSASPLLIFFSQFLFEWNVEFFFPTQWANNSQVL